MGKLGFVSDPAASIRDADFVYENMSVKVVANRDSQKSSFQAQLLVHSRKAKNTKSNFG
jgi:hypothetical protein